MTQVFELVFEQPCAHALITLVVVAVTIMIAIRTQRSKLESLRSSPLQQAASFLRVLRKVSFNAP